MKCIGDVMRAIVAAMVAGDWSALERVAPGSRLSPDDIKQAVEAYGRTLVLPPPDSFDQLDAVEVTDSAPRAVSIDFPLWTSEEGRSDLELRLTATEVEPGSWSARIDGVLVP